MPPKLDIKQVLKGSVSEVSLDALTRKGFKQVKVLNQGTVMRLIAEAVDRVLSERSREISEGEREKVIKESRSQFEALAKQRLEKERSRIEDLENANRSLAAELETLKKRSSASIAVQAERDQAKARSAAVEAEAAGLRRQVAELKEHLTRKGAEVSSLQAELGARASEIQRFSALMDATLGEHKGRVSKAEEERESLQRSLRESQRRTAELEGLLAAKQKEIEEAQAAPASDATVANLLSLVTDRMQKDSEPSDVKEIKAAIEALSRKLSNISLGGLGGAGGIDTSKVDGSALEAFFSKAGGEQVESNVSRVKMKEAKAAAVKGALAKLKQIQKGGEDGE